MRWSGVLMVAVVVAGCRTVPSPEQEAAWQAKQEKNRVELATKKEAEAKAKAQAQADEQARADALKARCDSGPASDKPNEEIECGDLAQGRGDNPGAIARWRTGLLLADKASQRESFCMAAVRIRRASMHPEKDLDGVSPAIVTQCVVENNQQAVSDCETACIILYTACLKGNQSTSDCSASEHTCKMRCYR